uniref:Uncharacterized protein n=1 Tax=Arundo donax TaxID=35708 RepID=A0A0A9FW43_ARUDO
MHKLEIVSFYFTAKIDPNDISE